MIQIHSPPPFIWNPPFLRHFLKTYTGGQLLQPPRLFDTEEYKANIRGGVTSSFVRGPRVFAKRTGQKRTKEDKKGQKRTHFLDTVRTKVEKRWCKFSEMYKKKKSTKEENHAKWGHKSTKLHSKGQNEKYLFSKVKIHTHTHTHTYIYIYIYMLGYI